MSDGRIELRLRGPRGEPVDLWRTMVSHGFHELAPTSLDEERRSLSLTVRVPRGKPRRVTIAAGRRGYAKIDVAGPPTAAAAREAIAATVARVLHLDQDLSAFYAIAADDPRLGWAATGAGRMLRSPTVWEDVVKTLCTTNCSWGLTVTMVNALVSNLGDAPAGNGDPLIRAFPSAEVMAGEKERFYREVVRSGYRAPRFIELAELQATGAIDLEALGAASREEIPDEEVERQLLALPGSGPYAAAHVMMTIGRNSKLILDSWTRPKYTRVTGARRQPTDAADREAVHAGTAPRRASRSGWSSRATGWTDPCEGLPCTGCGSILPEALPSPPDGHANGGLRMSVPMAPRRALARRTKRLIGYWRSETRTIRQGLVALVLSTAAGFVAGLTSRGTQRHPQLRSPACSILIPAAVGMRARSSARSGRASAPTNAAGTVRGRASASGGVLRQNVYVAIVTTFSSSLWLAVLAQARPARLGQPSISIWSLSTISVIGGALGSVAHPGGHGRRCRRLSYRRGWDLDSVSTPMVTALGDMVTLPTPVPRDVPGAQPDRQRRSSSAICAVAALVRSRSAAYTVRRPVRAPRSSSR